MPSVLEELDNATRRLLIPAAALTGSLYAVLAGLGDLRERPGLFLGAHTLLLVLMLVGWRAVARGRSADYRIAVAAALLFRVAAAWGDPALSDDVYRFVWDGRVQLHGIHPYAYAPLDPELAPLRDEVWSRINHPELATIYPPLAEIVFATLAAVGAGPVGFKLALGLADFGVVLALALLLGALGLPRERVVLYAWNPLAVLETAGSGHVEPLGVLLVLLSAAWIIGRRRTLSTLALAAAVHVKLLPAVLLPGLARRLGARHVLLLVAALGGLALPYALLGPPLGAGTLVYAERWEHNAFLFAGLRRALEWVDPAPALKAGLASLQEELGGPAALWGFLHRHVWPGSLARLIVAAAAVGWILRVQLRLRPGPAREAYLSLGGVLLLSPTLHPWYVLWVLPFAVAQLSPGWLVFAALVPLSYAGGDGDVAAWIRWLEYLPLWAWIGWRGVGSRWRRQPPPGRGLRP